MDIAVRAIATVRNARVAATDDDWGQVESRIELAPELPAESVLGLETFSHVEVLFFFDRVPESKIEHAARHPREFLPREPVVQPEWATELMVDYWKVRGG